MSLPEYYTTSCQEYREYWGDETDPQFACKLCGEPWPQQVRIYPDHTRVCGDKHQAFHRAYRVVEELSHKLLGDQFNTLSICLKLNEEGII